MESRKRRITMYHRFDNEPRPRSYIEEAEEARPEYDEEELLPLKKEEIFKPQSSLSLAVPHMYFVRDLLKKCWCKETAYQESLKSGRQCPSRGQCYVTAILIQEIYGGEVITGTVNGEEHYWNKINSMEIDFTSDQYGKDGYHPILGIQGVTAKINKENKRFQLLRKRWEELCHQNENGNWMF